MKVILAQLNINFGLPSYNLKGFFQKLQDLKTIETLSDILIIAPELFLTGYSKEAIEAIAFSDKIPLELDEILTFSKKENCSFYFSTPEKEEGQFYNTGIFIEKGAIIAKYRKSHLFGPMGEKSLFNNGEEVIATKYTDQTIGLSICYDLRFPGLFQELSRKNSEIMLIVAEWPITRIEHWITLARARAIENQCYVIAVNRIGSDPDYMYGGNSLVIDPFGEIEINLREKETLKFHTLDLSKVSKVRELFEVQRDRWI